MTAQPEDELEYGPSRSQKRRDALVMLQLAAQLVELPPSRIGKLELPDDVRHEIAQVRRISSHIARKRQLQFLAKLMRRHGEDAFGGARAALGEDRQRQRQETAAMHRLEAVRERLIDEEDGIALTELLARHPHADRQHLRSLIRQARTERQNARPAKAYREIFQVLKALAQARPENQD